MPPVRTGSYGENVVWPVSVLGQPQQVIELGSLGDQILDNLRRLVPHAIPVEGGPKLLAAEHGHKHLVEFHGVEVRVGVLLEAANTILHHQNSTRGAGGHAVKDSEHVEEAEEDIAHVAKHFDGRCEAVNILDGIVPLAQENEVLQVCDAKEHVCLLDKRFEGGEKAAAALEEGEKAAVTEPRHAGVLQ